MKTVALGIVFVGFVAFAPGCIEDKCKNPKIVTVKNNNFFQEGPGVKCNVVTSCSYGGRVLKTVLMTVEDPVVIDSGSSSTNKRHCIDIVRYRENANGMTNHCEYEASPETMCLDVINGPDGSSPDVGGPTGGTLVTVGVGSGDYYLEPEGAGDMGGFGPDDDEDDSSSEP